LEFRVTEGRLEVRPSGRLTPVERGAIRSHLSELLALAAWDESAAFRAMENADALVDRLGVRGSDARIQSSVGPILAAHAARDATAFRAAVEAFRECVLGVAATP
jgi:hypothetical protein